MKFWVKAIGEGIQEQLLVRAENCEELQAQLTRLLHVPVTHMSITDFATQVVERVGSGADIITVRVTVGNVATEHSGVFDVPAPITESPAPLSRSSSSMGNGPQNLGGGSASRRNSATAVGEALMDRPQIEKICLRRSDVVRFVEDNLRASLEGCFVRVKDTIGPAYSVVQVVAVQNDTHVSLDLIHVTETRNIDALSNSAPTTDECKKWCHRMIGASRSLVTPGFVEAKYSDIESELRMNQLASTPSPPPSLTRRASPVSLDYDSLHHSPPLSESKARKRLLSHDHAATVLVKPPLQKNLIKTNDVWIGAMLIQPDEPHARKYFIGTRYSNTRSKHERASDCAGAALLFNDDLSVVELDRDITPKGYQIAGSPQRWRGSYWAASCSSVPPDPTPEPRGHIMDLMALSGRDVCALYNDPIPFTIPLPRWATSACRVSPPQLLSRKDTLHLFLLCNMAPTPMNLRRGSTAPSHCVGLAHLCTTDPKLLVWSIISDAVPVVLSTATAAPLFHVSNTIRRNASGLLVEGGSPGLTLLWCDDANGVRKKLTDSGSRGSSPTAELEDSTISKYTNSDDDFRVSAWTPTPAVCIIGPQEEWRANGTRSISLYSPGGADPTQYVVVAAEDAHRHAALVVFPTSDDSLDPQK